MDTIEHGLYLQCEPELLDQMAADGRVLVPTLSSLHNVSEDLADKYPCVLMEQVRRQHEEACETLASAKAAGVKIAVGFDSHHPVSNASELVWMVGGGLTAMEGLIAATSNAAAALGFGDLGVVQPDAVADLLILGRDPLPNPAVLLDPDCIDFAPQAGKTRRCGEPAGSPMTPRKAPTGCCPA